MLESYHFSGFKFYRWVFARRRRHEFTGQPLLSAILVDNLYTQSSKCMDYLLLLSKRADKERYRKKLLSLHGNSNASPDVLAYNFSEEKWINDPTQWPSLKYPSIYAYLIDTPGEFTRRS